jgi:ABC-2 type transport system permease protein
VSAARLAGTQVRASVLELLRYPSFSLPALLFPSAIFLVLARAYDQPADTRMAGFAAVAILGVVFFQFGVGIAAERVSSWETFLRTLPVAPRLRIATRVASGLVFASAAAVVVVGVAAADTAVSLEPARWPLLAAALLVGAVPFGLLGIAIGYAVRPRAALPLANLLYLPLSYAGGLWVGPGHATGGAARILDLIPTHAWAVVLWWTVGAVRLDGVAVASLAVWALVFGAVAAWAYRRDEGERFS